MDGYVIFQKAMEGGYAIRGLETKLINVSEGQ